MNIQQLVFILVLNLSGNSTQENNNTIPSSGNYNTSLLFDIFTFLQIFGFEPAFLILFCLLSFLIAFFIKIQISVNLEQKQGKEIKETVVGVASENERNLFGYKVVRLLGRGGYGFVYLVEKDGKSFAMKQVKRSVDSLSEIHLMQTLDHPNILKMYTYYMDEGDYYIVMEYADGGDLLRYTKSQNFDMKEYKKIVHGVLCGLEYIHDCRISHNDIKPGNIMIVNGVAKIGDFGMSCITINGVAVTNKIGSLTYSSPENLEGDRTTLSDVWAVGVTIATLFSRRLPFRPPQDLKDRAELLKLIKATDYEEYASHITDDKLRILALLCFRPAATRPTCIRLRQFLENSFM